MTIGDFEGAPHLACALTWVAGRAFADVRPRSLPVLEELGAFLAQLDLALSTFDHPELGPLRVADGVGVRDHRVALAPVAGRA